MNVISAHVVVDDEAPAGRVLDALDRCLATQFDIEHSTFQLEHEDRSPREDAVHR